MPRTIASLCTLAATVMALALAGAAPPAAAQDKKPTELAVSQHTTYDAKGLRTIDTYEELTINSEAAIEAAGQMRVVNNDHFFDLEIAEAATLKPDGRKIAVAPERIFSMSGAAEGAALFSADTTIRIIPYANLGVGDRRILHLVRHEKAQKIEGVVYDAFVFPAAGSGAAEDLTLDIPDSLHLKIAERGLAHREEAIAGGRRLIWHVDIKPGHPAEPFAVAPIDRAPFILLSNAADWGALGRIYASEIDHLSDPDPAVTAQAEEITKGLTDRRAIARALFEWTSRNIRYFNVVLGAGGFVPHAPGAILSLRYGDCKDHATLLRALLAAKGIASEYVLVNLGRVYGDYPLPILNFDHMIVYVPEFGLYLDPTDATSAFDALSPALRDKAVLRLTPQGGIAARTPLNAAQDANVLLTANIAIGEDGRASGTSIVEAHGSLAEDLRFAARRIALSGAAQVAQSTLAAQNWRGSGRFETPSFLDKADPYRIGAVFKLDKSLFGPDGEDAVPTGPRLFPRPTGGLVRALLANWSDPFACGIPQAYTERLKLTWPAKATLKKVPENVMVTAGFASYRATYALVGNSLEIERTFRFSPPHAFCRPGELKAAGAALVAANRDFGARLAFDLAARS